MFNKYPYTDFHEMNTDWIISKIKNVETAEANSKQYAEDADAAKVAAEDARDNAVDAKDTAVQAKDDAVEAKNDAVSFLTDTKDQLDLLQSRVDNIIPQGTQTQGNTELLDIRVGWNSATYASAGDAVRGQVSDLHTDVSFKANMQYPLFPTLGGNSLQESFIVDDVNHTMTLKAGLAVWTGLASPIIIVVAADDTVSIPRGGKIFLQNDAGVIKLYACTNGAYAALTEDVRDTFLIEIAQSNNSYKIEWTYPMKISNLELRMDEIPEQLTVLESRSVSYLAGNGYILIRPADLIDGYYVNYNDGVVSTQPAFCVSPMVPVTKNIVLTASGGDNASQVAFYDADGIYVQGILCRTATSITVPNDSSIAYMRWCTSITNKSSAAVSIFDQLGPDTYHITTSIGILEGVMNAYAGGYRKVVVEAGQYDIMQEYIDHYGATCWDDYDTAYNVVNMGIYGRGVWLDNIDITFMPGSSVVAHYTGNNANVKTYFSPFAVGSDATVTGLVVDSTELRYCVHPDFHPRTYETLVFKNCDFHHLKGGTWNEAVGCGFGVHSSYTFENCIFRSDGNYRVFRIHNASDADAQSNAYIKNCYVVGTGYMSFNNHGDSTAMSTIEVCGCSWINPAVVGTEPGAENVNMQMIAWNNEIRP